jgi:phage-related tail protein
MNSTARAERMKTLRRSIEREIVELEAIENDYYEKLADQSDAIERFKVTQVALKQAARDAKQAVQDELDARRALERAQKRVSTTKQTVNELSKSFSKIQSLEEKATIEVDLISDALRKRQEKVRLALRKKQVEIDNQSRLRGDKVDEEDMMDFEEDLAFMDAIEKLRREEGILLQENERIEMTISQLLSRSNKLKLRAEQLDSLKVQVVRDVC